MKKKIILIIGFCLAWTIASEWFYFHHVFRYKPNVVQNCDVVLVYGDSTARNVAGLDLTNKARVPLFISEAFAGPKDVEQKIGPSKVSITVDHFARTTDQNARNAVKFLKAGGFHKALLVTSWFHMPRALFLTRLYLIGFNLRHGFGGQAGITVEPYPSDSLAKNYWTYPDFWAEIFRFWGSLARVGLALLGFEKPWFHS